MAKTYKVGDILKSGSVEAVIASVREGTDIVKFRIVGQPGNTIRTSAESAQKDLDAYAAGRAAFESKHPATAERPVAAPKPPPPPANETTTKSAKPPKPAE